MSRSFFVFLASLSLLWSFAVYGTSFMGRATVKLPKVKATLWSEVPLSRQFLGENFEFMLGHNWGKRQIADFSVYIQATDDGNYGIYRLYDDNGQVDKETLLDGSYVVGEDGSTAVLQYTELSGEQVVINISGLKERIPDNPKDWELKITATKRTADGTETLSAEASLTYSKIIAL